MSILSCPLVNYSALNPDLPGTEENFHVIIRLQALHTSGWTLAGVAPPRGSADLDVTSSAPSAPSCRGLSAPRCKRGRVGCVCGSEQVMELWELTLRALVSPTPKEVHSRL